MIRIDPLMLNCSFFGKKWDIRVGKKCGTVPIGGDFSQFDYANGASTEELPYLIDSSRLGLIPDGRDCFFNIFLGVLFRHVRHCCVYFV